MVLPEGTEADSSRPRIGRTVLFILTGLAIMGGFLALGALLPAEPVAAPTTTTTTTIAELDPPLDPETFTVSQIERGEPLHWELLAGVDAGYPLALTEHQGELYLFATATSRADDEPGGLSVWRSHNGVDWTIFREVIGQESKVATVISTPNGLVAAGSEASDSDLLVWESDDALEWSASVITTDTQNPYMVARPTTIAETENLLAISAEMEIDRQKLLEDRLEEAGLQINLSEILWGTQRIGEEDVELIFYGPLGMAAMRVTLDELGLSSLEQQWVTTGLDQVPETDVWVRHDESSWQHTSIAAKHVNSIVSRPDGTLVALGTGGANLPQLAVSNDGTDWTSIQGETIPAVADRWGDLMVGLTEHSPTSILVSDDGLTWNRADVSDEFRHPIDWRATALGAGPDGLAITMEGGESGRRIQRTDLPTIRGANGSVLALDFRDGLFDLQANGFTYSWKLRGNGPEPAEGIEVDLERQVVSFTDPGSGETVGVYSFDDLRRAEREFFASNFASVEHQALVFTEHGAVWTIQDLAREFGEHSRVGHLETSLGRVTAIRENRTEPLDLNPIPGFEIWSAEIP